MGYVTPVQLARILVTVQVPAAAASTVAPRLQALLQAFTYTVCHPFADPHPSAK